MQAAIVYRVTGDPLLLKKIKKMLRATVDHYLLRTDVNSHIESRLVWVAALDWVWNDLTPPERKQLAGGLINYVYSLYVEDRIRGTLDKRIYGALNYYERNITWYAGLVALNNYLDDVEYAKVLAILGRGFLLNQGEIGYAVKSAGDDGAFRTALDYYFGSTLNPFWQFLHWLDHQL